MTHIAIIGNGIIALSTAYSLTQKDRSLKISIIGKQENNTNSASFNAGAMLAAFSETTQDTLTSNAGRIKFETTIQALKKWHHWVAEINTEIPKELHIKINKGIYLILNTISGHLDSDNYNAVIQSLDFFKETYYNISPRKIPGFDPIENCRATNAIFIPNEGNIEPTSVQKAILHILHRNNNVTFINENAKSISKDKHILLETNQTLLVDKILVCTGYNTTTLLSNIKELNGTLPLIMSGVGYAAIISQIQDTPITNVIRTTNRSGACGLHIMPSGKDLYIGATNSVYQTKHTHAKMGLLQFLIQCGIQQINQKLYNSDIYTIKTGNRPASIDGFPLIGELSIQDIFIISGTYRDGFTQSPVLSDFMSNLILNKSNKQYHDLDKVFKPQRSLIKIFDTVKHSIAQTVNHYIAGLHEHRMTLPSLMNECTFKDMLYKKLSHIYDKLETDFPLSPDILFLFELNHTDEDTLERYKIYFKNRKKIFKY